MQEYASTSQTPPSKSSCHDSKSFIKPSLPKTLHARVCLNFTASPLQDFLSPFQDSKACFKPPPSKTLHATFFFNFTASPVQDFWARFQVIFLTSCIGAPVQRKKSTRIAVDHLRVSFPSNTYDLVAHRDMPFCR